jgi:hypothetical protein
MGKKYHYLYRITFRTRGWFYYGSHTTDRLNDQYYGSPHTHKDKWDNHDWEMEILQFFDTRDELLEMENRVLRNTMNDPYSLNENCGGGFTFESCSKGGKIGGKTKATENHITRDPEAQRKKSLIANKSPKMIEHRKKLCRHNVESGHLQRISQDSAEQRSKPVIAIFPDGTEKEYWGAREASRQLRDWKVNPVSIGRCAMGKQIQHQGLRFKFK